MTSTAHAPSAPPRFGTGSPSQPDPRIQALTSCTHAYDAIQTLAAKYAAFYQTVQPPYGTPPATGSAVATIGAKILIDSQLAMLLLWPSLDDNASHDLSGFSGVAFSAEAMSFCLRAGITLELNTAINLTGSFFSVVGNPSVSLMEDPEMDRVSYLVIRHSGKRRGQRKRFAPQGIRTGGGKAFGGQLRIY